MNHKNNLQKISLCIPRIDAKTPKKYIQRIFHNLNIGTIEEIHEILIHNDSLHKRIIMSIHLKMDNPIAQKICNAFTNNANIKIVHEFPWYWICVKYINKENTATSQVV
jgi:hypothetical protein